MAFRVAEYAGPSIAGHGAVAGPHTAGLIRAQFSTGLSTGATPSFTLSSGTYGILIDTDQGALVAFGSSLSTAPTVTSTNGQHIPVNVAPLFFYAKPYAQLFVAST